MDGLHELLNRDVAIAGGGRDGFFDLPNSHAAPGFWTAYVARARLRNLMLDDLAIRGDALEYAKAIAIEHALGQADTYHYSRKHAGANYSPLVLLESREQTDGATGEINSCIRRLFQEPQYSEFVSKETLIKSENCVCYSPCG